MDAIYADNNLDMIFCMISNDDFTYLLWYGEDAEAAVRDSFPAYDGGGRLIITPRPSRKNDIVPPLTATLESRANNPSPSPRSPLN